MDILQSLAPPVSTGELPLTVSGTGSGMALVMANLQWHGGMVGCSVDNWSARHLMKAVGSVHLVIDGTFSPNCLNCVGKLEQMVVECLSWFFGDIFTDSTMVNHH